MLEQKLESINMIEKKLESFIEKTNSDFTNSNGEKNCTKSNGEKKQSFASIVASKNPPIVTDTKLSDSAVSNIQDLDQFHIPKGHLRKAQQRELKHKKTSVINGTAVQKPNSLVRGAPEPNREIFVYRVDKATTASNIVDYLATHNIVTCDTKK
jgi:hypothetical protein